LQCSPNLFKRERRRFLLVVLLDEELTLKEFHKSALLYFSITKA
jgi:hypothetical protein